MMNLNELEEIDMDIETNELFTEIHDELFTRGKTSCKRSSVIENVECNNISTMSNYSSPTTSVSTKSNVLYPQVPVRTGYKTFNMDVIEALTVMESVYKVDAHEASGLLAYIANKEFNRNWTALDDKKKKNVNSCSIGDEKINDEGKKKSR